MPLLLRAFSIRGSIARLEAVSGLGDLDDFLVRARSGRTKEVNESSGERDYQMFCVDICPSEAPLVSPLQSPGH